MLDNTSLLSHFESLYPDETRFKEIEQLISYIKSGKSVELIGLPGVGRSNLMKIFPYNTGVRLKHLGDNQKWYHFVYMDFSEVRKRSPYDVIKFMLISLAYSLSERKMSNEYEAINKYIKEALPFNDELILFQALKKSIDYLGIEKELTVIFLFDRFEQYVSDVSDQFFLNLKILRNRAKYRFSAVFSLSHPLEDLLDGSVVLEFSEYISGNYVYLSLYDKPSLSFRLAYLEKITGKKLDEKLNTKILQLTAGLGKLTYASYEAVLSVGSPGDTREFLLIQKSIKNVLSEIESILSPYETKQLRLITKNNASDEKSLAFLEKIGLVANKKITIPLFEEFLNSFPQQEKEHISINLDNNELYKGTDPLSSKLSRSEFLLLSFLLKNPDRVCEKNELIKAIWKDSKTQEGVTDQALDQIIYRLRKKIEDDPNNPTHIQTVKGRGVRFMP